MTPRSGSEPCTFRRRGRSPRRRSPMKRLVVYTASILAVPLLVGGGMLAITGHCSSPKVESAAAPHRGRDRPGQGPERRLRGGGGPCQAGGGERLFGEDDPLPGAGFRRSPSGTTSSAVLRPAGAPAPVGAQGTQGAPAGHGLRHDPGQGRPHPHQLPRGQGRGRDQGASCPTSASSRPRSSAPIPRPTWR